ncbi:PLP-dependent aminotransferase family protein [Streptomyces sp. NPDC059994]|uniref:aminotransferase-like domain-containing protein n=1 Tax=Streptomyces sp. NPDC059994 TaxID=3347029 RepID=UPI003697151D
MWEGLAEVDYRRLADGVAKAIAEGRLRPGDRLPPQRTFARRHRVAVSTAIRAYGELVRRGLVVGEVGRGTFVRAAPPHPGSVLAEDSGRAPVNLELNYPVADGQSELMARGLAGLARPDVLLEATRPAAADGTPGAREAAARVLARPGWHPDPDRLLFAGNGRQAIAAALSALVRPGGRVGVEELTYPLVKAVAERLGITLVPIGTDGSGLLPSALEAAHRRTPLSAVYVQPTLHNPLSLTMPGARREELARVLRELALVAVEDTTWAFLAAADTPPPLAAYAPERTLLVDSLSKRLAPGLTVGFLSVPEAYGEEVARALRSGAWTAGRFNLEAAVRWVEDGTVEAVTAAKRAEAGARHALVAGQLGDQAIRTDPCSYYCWWELPAPWRAETFAAAAAEELGIAVTPGSAFAVGAASAPDAVRVGLASPPRPVLDAALRRLAELAVRGRSARP